MRMLLLASAIGISLVHTASAGRQNSPQQQQVFDPITNPKFTEAEQNVRLGTYLMASVLLQKCENVPWQYSTNFGKSLAAWSRTQGISPDRAKFLVETVKPLAEERVMPCEQIPGAMTVVSKNWMH